MNIGKRTPKTPYDGKTKEQLEQENNPDFILDKKEELFDHIEPNQVRSNFRYNFGGIVRATLVFFVILALVIGAMLLYDNFKVYF